MCKKIIRSGKKELRIVNCSGEGENGLHVKTLYASICFWADWNFFTGASKNIKAMGHESVVEVLSDFEDYKKGMRLSFYYQEGAFSQKQLLFPRNLAVVNLPERMPLKQAVFCEPVLSVLRLIDSLETKAYDEIHIGGGGPIGVIFHTLLKRFYLDKRIVLIEVDPVRRKILQNRGISVASYCDIDDMNFFIDCFGENMAADPEKNYLEIFSKLQNDSQYIIFGHSNSLVRIPLEMVSRKNITLRGVKTDINRIKKLVPIASEVLHTVDFSWMITEEISFEEIPGWFRNVRPAHRAHLKTGVLFNS